MMIMSSEKKHSIVSQLEGSLLVSKNLFPYFMLVAFEAGGPFRAAILLLVSPIIWFLDQFARFEEASLRLLIFVSTVGLRIADMDAVAKATLPRFFLEDVRESAYRVFSRCGGRKHVMTCIPRIMAEPFLREYLDVDRIIGTEMRVFSSYCTGLVTSKGVVRSAGGTLETMRAAIGEGVEIDIGLGHGLRDDFFMSLCRELYLITPEEKPSPLSRTEYPHPLIFHDGRFVTSPTVTEAIAVAVWVPLGILIAILRLSVGLLLPYKLNPMCLAVTGLRIRAQLPATIISGTGNGGKLYVCSHRTLVDPVFISIALQRRVSTVTYSLSRFSELISPIPTTRLTRDRSLDSKTMRALLTRGDMVVCPEGTTCREPYLLRFSPLFAEIVSDTNDIVPVAVTAEGSMFYGTTVRGYKCLDSVFFLMNPTPLYRMIFLELDPPPRRDQQLGGAAAATITANQIQRCIGDALGFECTNLTRKDKYRMLAGNDGVDLRCTN